MKVFYVPQEKRTGSPICILEKPNFLKTTKGVTKAWLSHDFVPVLEGRGDITMEWIPQNKDDFGKSCVLSIDNFALCKVDTSRPEKRNWFCKGNFKRQDLQNFPIVVSDGEGKNRQNVQRVQYLDCYFSLALNNAISKEKQSGASTILRVF